MYKYVINKIIFVLLLTCFLACGGGTTGTGAYSTRNFSGTLKDTSGNPLINFNLTVLENGDSTSTDQNGKFLLSTELENNRVTFVFDGGALNNELQINDLPDSNEIIYLEIEADQENNAITLLSLKIIPLTSPDPTPSPVLDNDDKPKPTPTPNDGAKPKPQKPTPIATPTPTPILNNIYKGKVIDHSGEGLSGVKITLQNYSKSVFTNNSGNFEISSRPGSANINLLIQYFNHSKTISFNIPDESVLVQLSIKITLEDENNGISINNAEPKYDVKVNISAR